jgi:hypothetical protein
MSRPRREWRARSGLRGRNGPARRSPSSPSGGAGSRRARPATSPRSSSGGLDDERPGGAGGGDGRGAAQVFVLDHGQASGGAGRRLIACRRRPRTAAGRDAGPRSRREHRLVMAMGLRRCRSGREYPRAVSTQSTPGAVRTAERSSAISRPCAISLSPDAGRRGRRARGGRRYRTASPATCLMAESCGRARADGLVRRLGIEPLARRQPWRGLRQQARRRGWPSRFASSRSGNRRSRLPATLRPVSAEARMSLSGCEVAGEGGDAGVDVSLVPGGRSAPPRRPSPASGCRPCRHRRGAPR